MRPTEAAGCLSTPVEGVCPRYRAYTGALKDHSGIEHMRPPELWAKFEGEHPGNFELTKHKITGVPLAELLGPERLHVDLFSLDVEGAEMTVLRGFPFDSIRVDYWFVETNRLDRKEFSAFMASKNYHCHNVDHVNSLCRLKEETSHPHGGETKSPKVPPLQGPL